MRARRKNVPLPEGRWIETIILAVFEFSPVTLEQLCRKMSAVPDGPPQSATYRALRRLQESGHVEARPADESWRGPRRGRKAIAYVLTKEGARAAAALAEPRRKRLAKRDLGRYHHMIRRGKTGHDMLLADSLSALSEALGQAQTTPWHPSLEEFYGEGGATRRLVHLGTQDMRPDALLTFGIGLVEAHAGSNAETEAVGLESSKVVRAQVFVEADMGTERQPIILHKLRRYVNVIFRTTSEGRTPDPNLGLPVVLFHCKTPRRALAVRSWMREVVASSHADEFRSNMLEYGIRLEDLFVVTCPEWWEARGVLGEAYLTPGSRLRRRDSGGGGEGLSVRGLGGFVSLRAMLFRLRADRKRGFVELELADLRRRVGAYLLSDKDINPFKLTQARRGARRLCHRLRTMRDPRPSPRQARRPRRT